jgi:Protein of unknown function (DUF2800)
MKTHSTFSASSSARLIACPGSFRLTRELIEAGQYVDRPSVYAVQGTVAHTVAEELLHHRHDPAGQAAIKAHYLDNPIVVDGHVVIPDADYLDHVETYTRYIETLESFDYDLHFESRVSPDLPWTMRGEKPPFDLYGTADCYGTRRRGGDDIVVVDLKFGSGVKVDVWQNSQLLYYALGVVSGLDREFMPPLDETLVELVVIQPRIIGGHEPKLFNTTVGEIIAWGRDVLRPAVDACLDPLATLTAGDHCKFCPAKLVCPELRDLANQKIREFFDDGYPMKAFPPDKLSDDLLATVPLEMWIEAIREEGTKRLTAGEAVPGHKLVAKRAIRKWTDPKAAVALAAKHGVNIVDGVMTPAQAEKACPPANFKPYYDKQSSGVVLAHESDPRPAVEPPKSTLLADLKGSLA